MAEIVQTNICTVGCGEARFQYNKYKFSQKIVFSKLVLMGPEEHFQRFFMKKMKTFGLPAKGSTGFSKLHSTCPEEHFEERYFFRKFKIL